MPSKVRYVANAKGETNRLLEYMRIKCANYTGFLSELKSVPCMDCGGKFPSECMDFDHARVIKLFDIGPSATRNRQRVLTEIAKCDIVCANCHRMRTFARRKAA